MHFITETNRIYSVNTAGAVVAEVTFPEAGDNAVDINRTFVDPSLRGQGAASQLMEAAYETIQDSGRKAYASCSYAIKWFDSHPEKQDVLK